MEKKDKVKKVRQTGRVVLGFPGKGRSTLFQDKKKKQNKDFCKKKTNNE